MIANFLDHKLIPQSIEFKEVMPQIPLRPASGKEEDDDEDDDEDEVECITHIFLANLKQ